MRADQVNIALDKILGNNAFVTMGSATLSDHFAFECNLNDFAQKLATELNLDIPLGEAREFLDDALMGKFDDESPGTYNIAVQVAPFEEQRSVRNSMGPGCDQ